MIRTETEYREALKRYQQDREFAQQQRAAFATQGLTPEQIELCMQPTLSFQAQLAEEIRWYEDICRGLFSPTNHWTDTGRVLIALRISKGLTQKQLADRLGVSESMVSRDERNEYHGITVERAQRIFQALGVDATLTVQDRSTGPCPPEPDTPDEHPDGKHELTVIS